MTTSRPLRPNLEQYKKQAKELLKAYQVGNTEARERIHANRQRDGDACLADAQLALAREHGQPSWPKFKERIAAVHDLGEALRGGGDADRVEDLVRRHPDIVHSRPWPQWDAATPLDIAAGMSVWHRPDMRKIAALMLKNGAPDSIHAAARTGLQDQVEAALAQDPDLLNTRDARDATPLYYAACVYGAHKEAEAVAAWLIEQGAEIDIFVAATCVQRDRVTELLGAEPDLATATDPYGMTALHWAVRPRPRWWCDDLQIAITEDLLAAGAAIDAVNDTEDGMQVIHHACEWSVCNDHIALLLERGADLNATAANAWTPLDYALDRDRPETARFLLERGAKTGAG